MFVISEFLITLHNNKRFRISLFRGRRPAIFFSMISQFRGGRGGPPPTNPKQKNQKSKIFKILKMGTFLWNGK